MVDTKKKGPAGAKVARPPSARRAKLPKEVASKIGQRDAQGDAPPECDVLRELGRGSCGVAWLVRRRRDKKLLVMKSVAISALSSTEEKAVKERAQAMREVQLLKEVKSTHVVQYAGAALLPATSKRSYAELQIFTEYCNGGDLATFLRRSGVGTKMRLPEDRVWKLSAAILAGVNELHRRQILHRDLKPANIFLHKAKETLSIEQAVLEHWPSLTVKVGDLGVARPLSSAESLASTLVGTPYYCAPEVLAGDAYCNKADIYSFGVCVYELMHGQPPHADIKNIAALIHRVLNLSGDEGTIAASSQQDDAYTAELRGFSQRCLARAPEERPSAPDAMLRIRIDGAPSSSQASQSTKAKRAQTPGPAPRRGAQQPSPRTPLGHRAQSASPRAGGSPRPQSPLPTSARGSEKPGKREASSPTPEFKFQPRPRARSSPGSRSKQPAPALPDGGVASSVALPPEEVEVTLRRTASEGFCSRAAKGPEVEPVQQANADAHSETYASSGSHCSSLAFSETDVLAASLGGFTALMAADLTLRPAAPTASERPAASSWSRRILARSAGETKAPTPKQAWSTATMLPHEVETVAEEHELTLKQPPIDLSSGSSQKSVPHEGAQTARGPGQEEAMGDISQEVETVTNELTLKQPPEAAPIGSSSCSSPVAMAHEGAQTARRQEDAMSDVSQEKVEDAAVEPGTHCKRFLQENRWRSAKGLPGKRPKSQRDEVVNYVAKAQDCWQRWREEKRDPASKQEKATALSLEIRGTAMSPGTRRKPVAAAA